MRHPASTVSPAGPPPTAPPRTSPSSCPPRPVSQISRTMKTLAASILLLVSAGQLSAQFTSGSNQFRTLEEMRRYDETQNRLREIERQNQQIQAQQTEAIEIQRRKQIAEQRGDTESAYSPTHRTPSPPYLSTAGSALTLGSPGNERRIYSPSEIAAHDRYLSSVRDRVVAQDRDLADRYFQRQQLALDERRVAALERLATPSPIATNPKVEIQPPPNPPPLSQRPEPRQVSAEEAHAAHQRESYLAARRIAQEQAEKKQIYDRAVWASRSRVISANWILGDPHSVYRAKLNELEANLRRNPSTIKLFEHPDWPEQVFAEFTKRYGQIPAVYRIAAP